MAKYRITSPEGVKFEITAPDTATQDEVLAYAQQNMGQSAPAEKPSMELTPEEQAVEKYGATGYATGKAVEAVGRAGQLGASGFNKGVAGGFGLPVDILNMGFGLVGLGSEEPVGGSRWINKNIMPTPVEPETLPEHIIGGVGEQLGAAAIPLGGGLGYVRLTGKVSAPIIKTIIGDLEKMPLRQLLGIEALMATNTGTASGVVRNQTDSPYADLAAQLVAGLGTAGALGVVQAYKKHLTAGGQAQKAAQALKESVPDIDRFKANMAKTQAIEGALGEDKLFTTAQATNEPSLIGTENAIIRTGDVTSEDFMSRVLNREAKANKVIGQFSDNMLPKGSIEDTKRVLLANEDASGAYSRNITDKYLKIDKESTGQKLYDVLSDAKTKKFEEVSGLFDDIGKTNLTVQPDELLKTLKTASLPEAIGGSTKNIPTELIERIKKVVEPSDEVKSILALPKPQRDILLKQYPDMAKQIAEETSKEFPYESLRVWRKEIGQEIGFEQKQISPNGDKIRRLKDIGIAVDEALDTIGERGDDIGGQYKVAKQRYKDEYLPYKQGAAADIRRRGARGETTKIAPEDMGRRFFKSGEGSIRATQDFMKTMGDKPAAVEALYKAAMNDAVESTIDSETGLVSAKKLGLWIKEHRDALNAFPEVREKVANIRRLQTDLDAIIKTNLFVKGDVKRIIPTLLNSKNSTQELNKILRVVGDDPKALNGLKKAVWEHAIDVTASKNKDINGVIIRDVNALKSFKKEYDNIFHKLYTNKELKDMNTFTDAYEIMTRTDKNPVRAGSPVSTFLNSQEGKAAANISFFGSRIWGLPYYGAVALAHTTKNLVGVYTKTQKEMLINQALLDPTVAEAFIKMANNAPVSSVKKAFDTALRNMVVDKTADVKKDPFGIRSANP